MNSSALPYWLSLMVLVGAGYGGWKVWQVEQYKRQQATGGITINQGPPLTDFEMTERNGEAFRSQDMLGKVWVASFFFASCQGTCSKLNGNLQHLNGLEELQDVTWVSITVDPVSDTLPVLNEYANRFSADPDRWLFCRSDFSYTKRVGMDYMKLPVMWKDHSDTAVVIDKAGKVRGYFDALSTRETKDMTKLLVKCLAEETPAIEESSSVPTEGAIDFPAATDMAKEAA